MRVLLAATVAWLALLALATGVTQQEAEATHSYKVDSHSAGYWKWQRDVMAARARKAEGALRRRWKPTVQHALRIASVVYRVPLVELKTVSFCESRWYPLALSGGGHRGLFQFGPVFESTSFGHAGMSPYDPFAASLAAAQIVSREGWRQWACKP